jgi:hypothetical protein
LLFHSLDERTVYSFFIVRNKVSVNNDVHILSGQMLPVHLVMLKNGRAGSQRRHVSFLKDLSQWCTVVCVHEQYTGVLFASYTNIWCGDFLILTFLMDL